MEKEVQNQNVKKGNPYMGFLWGILIVLVLNGLIFPMITERKIIETDYGTFIAKVESGTVKEVMIKDGQIYFNADEENGKTATYQTGAINDPQLVERLLNAKSSNPSGKIEFNQIVPRENSPILNFILMWVLPGLIFYLIWREAGKSIQSRFGGGGNFMSFGSSGAKIYADSDIKTTFADVAGQDEAKETLTEIVNFLHTPTKYAEIGATLPKGALLVGPPGTGKTLIARAVAGEAKVPFFSISGAEFVQMFAGMGAAKVRDLFKQANKKAPCIIFIDEIDAIGKKRDTGLGSNGINLSCRFLDDVQLHNGNLRIERTCQTLCRRLGLASGMQHSQPDMLIHIPYHTGILRDIHPLLHRDSLYAVRNIPHDTRLQMEKIQQRDKRFRGRNNRSENNRMIQTTVLAIKGKDDTPLKESR